MRVLLDEMLDRRLGRHLGTSAEGTEVRREREDQHEVQTVRERGWGSTKDGRLLELAEAEFDVFITADGNLPYQQNLARLDLAVIVLRGHSNRYGEHAALLTEVSISEVLASAPKGEATYIGPLS